MLWCISWIKAAAVMLELPACLSMWPPPATAYCRQMDISPLLPAFFPPNSSKISAALPDVHSYGRHLFDKHAFFANLLFCLVSVGMKAVPSAVDSAMVTMMGQRTSVQRSLTSPPPLTLSQAHPWDPDATLLSWWADILYLRVCNTACGKVRLPCILFCL